MASSPTDVAAETIVSGYELLGRTVPAGLARRSPSGVLAMLSRAHAPALNGILSPVTDPDPAEIAELAPQVAAKGFPWSIQLRTPPSAAIAAMSTAYGLTGRGELPLMILDNLAERAEAPAGMSSGVPDKIRVVDSSEGGPYLDALAAGFEAPAEVFGASMNSGIMDAGGARAHLVERDGVPIGTGFSVLTGDAIAIFNISTVPDCRRQGVGRAVTEAILRDGARDGATLAALQSSDAGYALYESMGFVRVETWTVLRPAA
jgi:N-acetylglutamate synthase